MFDGKGPSRIRMTVGCVDGGEAAYGEERLKMVPSLRAAWS